MKICKSQNALLAYGLVLALFSFAPNRAAAEGPDGVWQVMETNN